MLRISLREFQAAFADELTAAKDTLDAAMGAALIRKALVGDAQLLRFYARSRMKWNDRAGAEPERTGPPSEVEQIKATRSSRA